MGYLEKPTWCLLTSNVQQTHLRMKGIRNGWWFAGLTSYHLSRQHFAWSKWRLPGPASASAKNRDLSAINTIDSSVRSPVRGFEKKPSQLKIKVVIFFGKNMEKGIQL